MCIKILSLGWLCLAWFLVVSVAGARTWTDNQGRKIEAEFSGINDGHVMLVMSGGQEYKFPIEKLSPDDQKWVADNAQAADNAELADSGENSGAQKGQRSVIMRGDGPKAESSWPQKVEIDGTPEVEVVKEDGDSKQYVYRSKHYEFHSDIRLSKSVVREFSRIFEATYLLNCELPLDFAPQFEPGQKIFEARIFETREAYMKAGGMAGSGGVYMSRIKKFLVPIESLGVVNRGSRVTIDYDYRDFTTLIHEITHQMMNQWLGYLPIWYVEGSAVYTEIIDYKNGKFDLSNPKSLIKDHIGGREVKMLDPEALFKMDNATWLKALANRAASVNYNSAGMLAFYFYHIDGEGDGANIIKCLRNIESGSKTWEDSEKELLIRGRTMDQFREDLKNGYKDKMNVDVEFINGGAREG